MVKIGIFLGYMREKDTASAKVVKQVLDKAAI
jgi:hypothetical protein